MTTQHVTQIRIFMLLALALMAFAGNAYAQCTGKTVYIQLPPDWPQDRVYVKSDEVVSITGTKTGSWFMFTFPNNGNFNNAGKNFNFIITNNDNGTNRRITSVSYDQVSNQNNFNCGTLFGNNNAVYIYPNPNSTTQTRYGYEPPDAYYFYFYPPNEPERWKVTTPYIITYNLATNEQTSERMSAEPSSRCGWYKKVYFNEDPPGGDVWFFLSMEPTIENNMDLIGALGTQDPWDNGMPVPINLKEKFDQIATNPMKRELYFNPENGSSGWSGTDPGISDGGRCHYKLAANIYHTGCGANASFSAYDAVTGCSNDKDENGHGGEGVCRNYVLPTLSANGKMQWNNNNPNSCATLTNDWKKKVWKSGADLDKAFDPSSSANVVRCFDMPFQRAESGLWEFDALNLCGDGSADMDGKGACAGHGGGLGGFYPPNLMSRQETINGELKNYNAEYTACGNTCGATYEGDKSVAPPACVNMWCFDRGWYGGNCRGHCTQPGNCPENSNEGLAGAAIPANERTDPGMKGNLDGLTTKAQIDAEMNRVCYRPIRNGDLADYDNTIPLAYAGKTTGSVSGLMCFESSATFTYEKGQEFFFRGDDDIWVFINNQLVVDLGGNHGPAPGYVKLDTITQPTPLAEGASYPINIFFCDRRAPGSNVRITTNIYFTQKSGFELKDGKRPTTEPAEICLTVESTSGSTCGSSGGSSSEVHCGTKIGKLISDGLIEFYWERVGAPGQTILDVDKQGCVKDGNWLVCHEGIRLDLTNGVARIERDKIVAGPGLTPGTYNVFARVKPGNTEIPSTSPIGLGGFQISSGISIVWGEVYKDGNDGQPEALIRNLGDKDKRTVAGRLVPVGFADSYEVNGKIYVNSDPAELSQNKTFILEQAGLTIAGDNLSGLRIFSDELGQHEITSKAMPIPIGENGLKVLWVTGEYAAADDHTYRLMIQGRGAAGGSSDIKVFLPRFHFMDHDGLNATPPTYTILPHNPPTTWQTKGSDYSMRSSTALAKDMSVYIGSPEMRKIAAYDVSGSNGADPGVLCTDCGTVIPFNLRADAVWASDPSLGSGGSLISTSFTPLVGGISTLTFRGIKKEGIMHPDYAFFTVGGPSAAPKTLAQWDSLTFEVPVVPIPTEAQIFDRNGNGIGDELRIVYNMPFGDTTAPDLVEVFWDLGRLGTDTLSFGHPSIIKNEKGEYSNKGANGGITYTDLLAWWRSNHSIEFDSVIVIKCDDCFSDDIKTSVGHDPEKVVVRSWASFENKKINPPEWVTNPNDAPIEDSIPAIVIAALYEADGDPNCFSKQNPGCIDRVRLSLSEPVVYKDAETQAEAVKAAFAYKLLSYFGKDDAEVVPNKISPFEIYNDHLPTTMRWSSTGGDGILPAGDSVVNFAFKRYKVPGDTTRTPMGGDSVKFASIAHGVEFPALIDLAGNSANPMEIGRPLEGVNPSQSTKIPITELNPEENALEEKLKEIGIEYIFDGKHKGEDIICEPKPNCKDGKSVEGHIAVGVLPVPERWLGAELSSNIITNYPASTGLVFTQDIDNVLAGLEAKHEVAIPPSAVTFYANVYYHTNLGDFVVHRKDLTIRCDDPIFNAYPDQPGETCRENNGGVYVAWNLKDAKSRWVGAGAYVGIYDFYWKVDYEGKNKKGENVRINEAYDKLERKIEMHGVKRMKKR